jgi:AraC-like DNA-binding protein/DNA-binding MarR family transcriptional regulator
MEVLTDILRTARMECRVLSRHKMVRQATLAARKSERGYFYATTGASQLTSPGLAPVVQGPRGLVIWLSPNDHVLTSLDAEAEVVAGEIHFAEGLANPLVKNLPRLLHRPIEANAGLRFAFEQLLGEAASAKPGWERICDHLADLLVVQALRSEISSGTGRCCSGLRGLTDPDIGSALHIMHEAPDAPWTVGSLAKRLDVSRSNFAARFKAVVGDTPLGYLTRLRLHRAAAQLRDEPDVPLPVIARNVGYQTETAFGKSFKRQFGTGPGAYRRSLRGMPHRPVSALQRDLKKRDAFELLEQEVTLNLMRTADRFQQQGEAFLDQYDLVPAEFNILRILRGSGETLSADEIVARMVVRPLNANALLTGLKTNGLIEAAAGGLFRITPSGRDRLAVLDAPILDMHRQNLDHLTQAEKEELNRLLVKARQCPNGP